jgi:hypothetical protein
MLTCAGRSSHCSIQIGLGFGKLTLPPAVNSRLDRPYSPSSFGGQDAKLESDAIKDDHSVTSTPRTPWADRCRSYIQTKYYVSTQPVLVLPFPPSDAEKESYIDTRRWVLVSLGIFGSLAASAGIWFFTVCAAPFYWFALLAAVCQFELVIFYVTGCLSRDFDFTGYKDIRQDNVITVDNSPTIDIFLPCCKEPLEILANTYKYISQLQYPQGKLKGEVGLPFCHTDTPSLSPSGS